MQTTPSKKQLEIIAKNATDLNLNFSISSDFNKISYWITFVFEGFTFNYIIMNDGLYANLSKDTYTYFIANKQVIWNITKTLQSNFK